MNHHGFFLLVAILSFGFMWPGSMTYNAIYIWLITDEVAARFAHEVLKLGGFMLLLLYTTNDFDSFIYL